MISLKNIMYAIIKESNSCWDNLNVGRKVPPNRIDVRPLPVSFRRVSDFDQTGITIGGYIRNRVFCVVFLEKTVIDIVPKHVELILKEIVKQIILKSDNEDLLSENDREIINLISEEIGDIESNCVENPKAWNRVSSLILRHKTIMRQIYIKAINYKECSNINLFLYLVHHEANHCASALLTWRRGTCKLSAWGEAWIDFCTHNEINDFLLSPIPGYETSSNISIFKSKIFKSKSKHMIFVDYIINRALANGQSLEEIFKAIWRYCFDKGIEEKYARQILGVALNIDERHISELEKKEKFEEIIKYCNSNVPDFKFTGK